MSRPKPPHTRIAKSTATSVHVGGRDLVNELIGGASYTQMLYFLTCGRMPTAPEERVLDACLVTLMEHGLTPSALISRLMSDSVPEEPQVAIAAGLLAIGSVYAGTTEQCAALLLDLARRQASGEAGALREVAVAHARDRRPVPGFGHGTHKPDDPRAARLLEVARHHQAAGRHVALLMELAEEVDTAFGRHVTLNATGAIGALLLDIGVPLEAMRGFSVVARAGGLVGHLLEERRVPSAHALWQAGKAALPYVDPSSAEACDCMTSTPT
jgi:citrate synthase